MTRRAYYGRKVGAFAAKRREQQRLYEQAEKFDAAKQKAAIRTEDQAGADAPVADRCPAGRPPE